MQVRIAAHSIILAAFSLVPSAKDGLMIDLFGQLKGKLIVSCQASPGDPMENVDALRRMAAAAMGAGAAGLRVNSAAQVRAIRRDTDAPIIGIEKKYSKLGLRITPDFASAAALAAEGASIIALDCTEREWPGGEPWREIVRRIHSELKLPVMADIATVDEAMAAAAAGVDCVGTTLYGYTDETRGHDTFGWPLLKQLRQQISVPIIAEGRIAAPKQARRAIDGGAWCVVVGSAITRPGVITANFVRALATPSPLAAAIGVDIGGTFIKAGVVRADGNVGSIREVPTNASGGRDAIAAQIIRAIDEVFTATRYDNLEIAGIGIATAGVVNECDGSIFAATENLPGWAGFPLRAFVNERFRLPAAVINDGQAAALSELRFGAGRDFTDFVAITLGTGVGGGIVSGGRLLRGTLGFAGSIGHAVIRAGGRHCNCGRDGCVEAYVSTAALLREYRCRQGKDASALADDGAIRINKLAREGDPAAQAAYAELAGYLAEAIANLFNLLDPEAVILSGGLIEGYDKFVPELEERVTGMLHFGKKRKPQLRLAGSGRFAGVKGAASLALIPEVA